MRRRLRTRTWLPIILKQTRILTVPTAFAVVPLPPFQGQGGTEVLIKDSGHFEGVAYLSDRETN
jgi:hypothetical protein